MSVEFTRWVNNAGQVESQEWSFIDGDNTTVTENAGAKTIQIDASGGGGAGTVTSVSVTVPTGLAVSGSPVTTSGTIAIALDTGYTIPTTTAIANAATAFGWGNHASAGYLTASAIDTLAELNAIVGVTLIESTNAALTDARTPLAHTHGNIANGGTVGSTANLPLITGTAGIVQAGAFGTGATNFCVGNDARLSDARTPTAHTHTASEVTDFSAAVAATAAVTANTAKVTNATHTGDVTGSVALTIADDAVTNAKLANVATSTIKGRITGATGDPEDLTAAQVRTLINVADGANNYTHPNHSGAVTSTGDGATALGSFTLAALNTALSDADVATGGGTATGTNTGDQTITLTGDVTGSGTGSFATTIAAGAVDIAMLSATGAPSGSTYLRGDNTWATIAGGGDALVANPLSQFAATTSAQLRGVLSDELGTGAAVFDGATLATGITHPVGGLKVAGGGGYVLTVDWQDMASANRNLILVLNDANRTIELHGGIDFEATQFNTVGAYAVTLTATGATNVTLPTSGTLLASGGALGTPSSGTLTNCTGLPTAGLVDDAVTLAKMAAGTAGNLITYDASGNPAAVSTGTSGHVLTSNGAGAAPTFQAAAGGTTRTYKRLAANFATTSLSFVDVDNGSGDDWIFAVSANTDYEINVLGTVSSSATTIGVELGVNGPASPDSVLGEIFGTANAMSVLNHWFISSYDQDINFASGPASTSGAGFKMRILIRNGANSGNVAIRLRAEATGTATILAGAICDIQEITIS